MARITQLIGDVGPRESKISIISHHTKKDAPIKHQFPTQWESPCEIYLTLNQQLRIKGFTEERQTCLLTPSPTHSPFQKH